MDDYFVNLLGIWVAFICMVTLLFVAHDYADKSDEEREQAYQMINNGSKVYLDGCEVNPDVIVLEEYKVTIRDNVIILND